MVNKAKKCLALSLSLVSLISSVGSFKVFASGGDESYKAMGIDELIPKTLADSELSPYSGGMEVCEYWSTRPVTEEEPETESAAHFDKETKTLILHSNSDFKKIKKFVYLLKSVENVILEDGVTKVPEKFFAKCSNLKSIKGNNVTYISDQAFAFCSQLTEVCLPSAKGIGEGAFKFCYSLKKIDFPMALSLGEEAFEGCTNLDLKELHLKPMCIVYPSTFDGTGIIVNPKKLVHGADMTYYTGSDSLLPKSESMPEFNEKTKTLTISSWNNFRTVMKNPEKYRTATTVVLGDIIDTIPAYAFSGWTNLKSIKGKNVRHILNNAFSGCSELTDVSSSSYEIITIGNCAFQGCSKLEYVQGMLGSPRFSSVIGDYAFQGCSQLRYIILTNVSKVGKYAFQGCSELERVSLQGTSHFIDAIDIVLETVIEDYAFQGCTKLLGFNMYSTISSRCPEPVAKEHAFDDCPCIVKGHLRIDDRSPVSSPKLR